MVGVSVRVGVKVGSGVSVAVGVLVGLGVRVGSLVGVAFPRRLANSSTGAGSWRLPNVPLRARKAAATSKRPAARSTIRITMHPFFRPFFLGASAPAGGCMGGMAAGGGGTAPVDLAEVTGTAPAAAVGLPQ